VWIEDSPDPGNRNVAVELYWQMENTTEARPKVVVDLLEALMTEPLFDTLRTKQTLGYIVSCGARCTQSVLGFSVWLLSSKVGPAEICKRVEAFLLEFRQRVQDLPSDDIERHIVSLAAQKLEPHRTLAEFQETVWGELQERQRMFDRSLREAVALATVTREDVLGLLDDFIVTGAAKRRMLIVAAIGGRAKATRVGELGALQKQYNGARVVNSQGEFFINTTFYDDLL